MKKTMTNAKINEIIDKLYQTYPNEKCGLNYTSSFSLVVSLILAAQCTDERVNSIAPILFKKYPTIEKLSLADVKDIESIIKPCGFYKNKANNISKTAKKIVSEYGGNVPSSMENLTSLYGIGRKSANIILQECFNKTEGIAVDTHVSRTTYRIGFTKSNIPLIQEKQLMEKVDKIYWNKLNHILVTHGRKICTARSPKCDLCIIKDVCQKNKYTKKAGN